MLVPRNTPVYLLFLQVAKKIVLSSARTSTFLKVSMKFFHIVKICMSANLLNLIASNNWPLKLFFMQYDIIQWQLLV